MKIKMEIDENLTEDEIVIRCRMFNDDTVVIQKKIAELVNTGMQLEVSKGDTDYFLTLDEILFFETATGFVAVHTADSIFETKNRPYELEELLPGSFLRVSKSTILNTSKIRAIHKNITGASEVEFAKSNKKVFVSRNYFKILMSKLEEKRVQK